MPTLVKVETSCSYQPNATSLFQLCRVLVEDGFADSRLWEEAGRAAIPFASLAVERMLARVWDDRLNDIVQYVFAITDGLGEDDRGPTAPGSLVATIETDTAGYLIIGAALDRLEQEHVGLGAAFYRLFQTSLYRWIRVYDHTDASYYEDSLREMMENDDPDNQEAYEFPQVKASIPEFLQDYERKEVHAGRTLLRQFRSGPCGDWIERLLRIHRLSRLQVRHERVGDSYDDSPLPSLLVVFRQHDAVEASFDAEAQCFYEVSHEPAFAVPFRVGDGADRVAAIRSVGIFFRLNSELFELVQILNEAYGVGNGAP